jgi:hypothetical protein
MIPIQNIEIERVISLDEIIKILEEKTPNDKLDIDLDKKEYKDALNELLTLFKQSKSSNWNLWSKQEQKHVFYNTLIKNNAFTAVVAALYKNPHHTFENFIDAVKNSDAKLYRQLLSPLTMLPEIKDWMDKQFAQFTKLKNDEPAIYYSFLYHAALKHDNSAAQKEIIELFPDKMLLEKLKLSHGKNFRHFYRDEKYAQFWEKFSLLINQYYDKNRVLELIADKLLHNTKDVSRHDIIKDLLKSKNPLNFQLEPYLISKLSKVEQQPIVKLVTTSGHELPLAEFEVLSPTPEKILPAPR